MREFEEVLAPLSEHFIAPEVFSYPQSGPPRQRGFARLAAEASSPPGRIVTALDYRIRPGSYDENGGWTPDEDIGVAASRFALDQFLTELGIPDRVLLREGIPDRVLGSVPRLPGGLGVFYEELGVAIYLQGPTTPVLNGEVVHCFNSDDVRAVNVFTHASDDGKMLTDILDMFVGGRGTPFTNAVRSGVFIDVEAATGMPVDEFYEMYKAPTSRCLRSPLEIWTAE